MNGTEKDLILDPKQVAEILKCSLPTVYRLFDQPDFPSVKLGGSKRALRRVSREAFLLWINRKNERG